MTLEKKLEITEIFEEGIENYKAKNFEAAVEKFKKVLELDPSDGPSKVYIGRCEDYIKDPPPEDWDGVYIMKTK